MKINESPKVGWGILNPDPELSRDTLRLVEQISALPAGQRDALLTRAVPRYLFCELDLEEGEQPDRAQMVSCSTALSNFFFDLLGRP